MSLFSLSFHEKASSGFLTYSIRSARAGAAHVSAAADRPTASQARGETIMVVLRRVGSV